jgi:vanillate O-demethylase monooxygenase subunit
VLCRAFDEDRRMITAQAREIERDPGAPMLPLAMDAAVVRFRRLVADTIAAEQPFAPAAARA